MIHLIQGVRHGNPAWLDGYPTRLLSRPMSRILVSHQVNEACAPWLNRTSPTRTIVEGHHHEFFTNEQRSEWTSPLRVGYMTWKSEVGLDVERQLQNDPRFDFQSIREPADWFQIRDLYHWSDVLLGCPGPEEGFYLVGLEALAAGAILIMPDAFGNRAYARWGENCLQVEYNNTASYVDALRSLTSWSPGQVQQMRDSGFATLQNHRLDVEREAFGMFLTDHVLPAFDHRSQRSTSRFSENPDRGGVPTSDVSRPRSEAHTAS
jgi:hypothetical protein